MSTKKRAIKTLSNKSIQSVGTRRDYTYCLKSYLDWCQLNGVSQQDQSSKRYLTTYLEEKAEACKQKTICQSRMALNLAFNKKLPFVKSQLETMLNSRDYTLAEVMWITSNLQAKNAIAILICFYAGLRAHELATLVRINEGTRSSTRVWSSKLFSAIEQYQLYIVTGKGGLRRYVAIPNELAAIIEARRYSEPKRVCDREVYYQMRYDLGFGKALSQCFSRASLKRLGWSSGLHGTRHSYAKSRLKILIKFGFELEEAKSIVSQELGHFRPSIVNCYLR